MTGSFPGAYGGGGGSDVRINSTSLYARVIVAGGGGGSSYYDGTYRGYGRRWWRYNWFNRVLP